MTIKLKDLKVLPPDHPIYTEDFKTYPVNPSKNKKLHLTEVRPGMSDEQIKKNMMEALKKKGVEVKDIYKVNSLEDYKKQREKKEGLKNLFLEEIGDSKTSSEKMLRNLINVLEKSGIKIKGKPEKKKKEKDNK